MTSNYLAPKRNIWATMPEAFEKNFPRTTCIIQTAVRAFYKKKKKKLDSRGESYIHNTVRYLVAVALCGLII